MRLRAQRDQAVEGSIEQYFSRYDGRALLRHSAFTIHNSPLPSVPASAQRLVHRGEDLVDRDRTVVLRSPAMHAEMSTLPKAMLTMTRSSLTVTSPELLQSPTHDIGVAVGGRRVAVGVGVN